VWVVVGDGVDYFFDFHISIFQFVVVVVVAVFTA
jgi:hypothetical protein